MPSQPSALLPSDPVACHVRIDDSDPCSVPVVPLSRFRHLVGIPGRRSRPTSTPSSTCLSDPCGLPQQWSRRGTACDGGPTGTASPRGRDRNYSSTQTWLRQRITPPPRQGTTAPPAATDPYPATDPTHQDRAPARPVTPSKPTSPHASSRAPPSETPCDPWPGGPRYETALFRFAAHACGQLTDIGTTAVMPRSKRDFFPTQSHGGRLRIKAVIASA